MNVSFPKTQEENCPNNLFFGLFEILQMKSAYYVNGDFLFLDSKTVRNISESKKNLLLCLSNFGILLFYTEFKVVFKTKMSNTKSRNWYLSISNLKEMRETEREHAVRHTHKI